MSNIDVDKILKMLEQEDKSFAHKPRETVAKESLMAASGGDYDSINRLLEEDIFIDEKNYQAVFSTPEIPKKVVKKAAEAFESTDKQYFDVYREGARKVKAKIVKMLANAGYTLVRAKDDRDLDPRDWGTWDVWEKNGKQIQLKAYGEGALYIEDENNKELLDSDTFDTNTGIPVSLIRDLISGNSSSTEETILSESESSRLSGKKDLVDLIMKETGVDESTAWKLAGKIKGNSGAGESTTIGVDNPISSPIIKKKQAAESDQAGQFNKSQNNGFDTTQKKTEVGSTGERGGKPENNINFKSQNNGFDTDDSPQTGTTDTMTDAQMKRAAKEDLDAKTDIVSKLKTILGDIQNNRIKTTKDKSEAISYLKEIISDINSSFVEAKGAKEEILEPTDKNSAFPEELAFDEEAFAELFDLDPESISVSYVAPEENESEYIEIKFNRGEEEVIIKVLDNGEVEEVINAEIQETPSFTASISPNDDGEMELMISPTGSETSKSEEDSDPIDEDGSEQSDEFVDGKANLNLDGEWNRTQDETPAKQGESTKLKDKTNLLAAEGTENIEELKYQLEDFWKDDSATIEKISKLVGRKVYDKADFADSLDDLSDSKIIKIYKELSI